MHVPLWVGYNPPLNFRELVCGIVIDHDIHIELLGNILLNVLENLLILMISVFAFALRKDFTVGNL
jgi:hypothetical protein